MPQRVPARPGDSVDAVETPALVVDLDALEANLDAMAAAVAASGLRLRPHAKSHKCPAIAHAQLARGAVGICCQKTDEALAFVEAGVRDVLLTNEVVHPAKLARLAKAARDARVGLLVDCEAGAREASAAASAAGTTLDAYVEVDVGAGRCGVAPGEAAPLAALVAQLPGLRFAGLHCYHGSAQHLRTPSEREDAIAAARERVRVAKAGVERRGVPVPLVTGAGTGTWPLERASGAWNELQPGSYVFMDADYGRNMPGPQDVRFRHALFVLAAVMSIPSPERPVCDAGLKALAFDSGLPLVHERPGTSYAKASDEHGVLAVEPGAAPLALGERIRLIPGHCDPTANLYDWIVGLRDGRVESVWPVAARGALA
ncbi:MAG TPA: DSD1 family PLP-dependent enzyme [Casimicrobiaceae bacterium]|nr:DSD1 family PLP-dependent enzyme [Casimicrobiaceae bacterium]